jgi:hypothetical protein
MTLNINNNNNFFKAFLLIVFGALLFCFFSCSPQWHIKRAIHKDSTILKPTTDTIRIKTKEIVSDTTFKDSIEVDNSYLNIKVNRIGNEMNLFWKLKSVEYDTIFHAHLIDVYDTIYLKKTRQIIRLEAKQKRLETRKETKVELSKQRTTRVDKRKNNSSLSNFWSAIKIIISVIIAFILGLISGRFTKQFGIF